MTKIQPSLKNSPKINIRSWLQTHHSDIDIYSVDSSGLHLGTIEYSLPQPLSKLADVFFPEVLLEMPPLTINTDSILFSNKLQDKLPLLKEINLRFYACPIRERRLQTGAWLRDIRTIKSTDNFQLAATTIDDIGTEICYQISDYSDALKAVKSTEEDGVSTLLKTPSFTGRYVNDFINVQNQLIPTSRANPLYQIVISHSYNILSEMFKTDFTIGGTLKIIFHHPLTSLDSACFSMASHTVEVQGENKKNKVIIHFNQNKTHLATIESNVSVPSPMKIRRTYGFFQ